MNTIKELFNKSVREVQIILNNKENNNKFMELLSKYDCIEDLEAESFIFLKFLNLELYSEHIYNVNSSKKTSLLSVLIDNKLIDNKNNKYVNYFIKNFIKKNQTDVSIYDFFNLDQELIINTLNEMNINTFESVTSNIIKKVLYQNTIRVNTSMTIFNFQNRNIIDEEIRRKYIIDKQKECEQINSLKEEFNNKFLTILYSLNKDKALKLLKTNINESEFSIIFSKAFYNKTPFNTYDEIFEILLVLNNMNTHKTFMSVDYINELDVEKFKTIIKSNTVYKRHEYIKYNNQNSNHVIVNNINEMISSNKRDIVIDFLEKNKELLHDIKIYLLKEIKQNENIFNSNILFNTLTLLDFKFNADIVKYIKFNLAKEKLNVFNTYLENCELLNVNVKKTSNNNFKKI